MVHPASAQCPRRAIDWTSVCLQQGRHGSARGKHNNMKSPTILRILLILKRFLEKLTRKGPRKSLPFILFQYEMFLHTSDILYGQCENSLTRIRRLFTAPNVNAAQGVGEKV